MKTNLRCLGFFIVLVVHFLNCNRAGFESAESYSKEIDTRDQWDAGLSELEQEVLTDIIHLDEETNEANRLDEMTTQVESDDNRDSNFSESYMAPENDLSEVENFFESNDTSNTVSFFRIITVDHQKVATTDELSQYPLLVSISNAFWLKTVENGGRVQHPQGFDLCSIPSAKSRKSIEFIEPMT